MTAYLCVTSFLLGAVFSFVGSAITVTLLLAWLWWGGRE